MWKQLGVILILSFQILGGYGLSYDQAPSSVGTAGRLVKKDERMPLVSTEFGSISTVDIGDGTGRHDYHLQFITLEPNSLFLPVLLHADMVLYVHTGSGRLSWADTEENDELRKVELKRGDVYRIKSGSVFYIHSSLESERPRFRIIATFANDDDHDKLEFQESSLGPYSSMNDLIRGFDKRVLQAAFQVPEEVIEELTSGIDTPAIVHAETRQKKKNGFWEKEGQFINALLGIRRYNMEAAVNKKKHTKSKPFNFFKSDPDFHNCNGWSTVVTKHHLDALHGSQLGVFMVNLTKGSMMGPHWNPKANEVSVVLEGEGMVRVVCPSTLAANECKNTRFRVAEGDVYTVPRFHPMAQISFNDDSLVFMGFSTTTKRNHPQFLAGKASVLQTLDRLVVGASFGVSNTTIDQLLKGQEESIILECTSCAEEEETMMEKEIEAERKKEEKRREQEEQRRREEEEMRRKEEEQKKREEEEERQREEEEQRRREEEERRKEEEQKKREEEEERKREEEEQRRREEEERQCEEEEQRRREEEERQREEEEQRRERQREEEEQRRREEEERQREKEEQRREEEEQKKREEEEERQREEQREEEEQRRQEEEKRKKEEERKRREEEEEREREVEEGRKQEEERRREIEEEQRREEARRGEEEQRQEEKEEERRRQEEERREEEEGRGEEETEEEAARREEERVEREREEEEEARRREHEHPQWDLVKMA